MRPVFVTRYMVPALGCLWLGLVLALAAQNDTRWKAALAAVLLLFAVCSELTFAQEESISREEAEKLENFLTEIPEGAVLLSDSNHVSRTLAVYVPNLSLAWKEGNNESAFSLELNKAVYGNIGEVGSAGQFSQYLQSGVDAYIFKTTKGDSFSEEVLNNSAFDIEFIGNYFAECDVEVFRLLIKAQ